MDAGGEILGALCLRPDFKSEQLDALGKKPLDPNRSSKVWFQEDVPGDVYQQGMDRFVVWDDANDATWRTVLRAYFFLDLLKSTVLIYLSEKDLWLPFSITRQTPLQYMSICI